MLTNSLRCRLSNRFVGCALYCCCFFFWNSLVSCNSWELFKRLAMWLDPDPSKRSTVPPNIIAHCARVSLFSKNTSVDGLLRAALLGVQQYTADDRWAHKSEEKYMRKYTAFWRKCNKFSFWDSLKPIQNKLALIKDTKIPSEHEYWAGVYLLTFFITKIKSSRLVVPVVSPCPALSYLEHNILIIH